MNNLIEKNDYGPLEHLFRSFQVSKTFLEKGQYLLKESGKSNPNVEIMHQILKNGCNPNISAANRTTPLGLICEYSQNLAAISYLIEFGADLNLKCDTFGNSPLHLASRNSNIELMTKLLKHGADSQSVNNAKGNSLHSIIIGIGGKSKLKAIELLIRHQINIDAQTTDGQTALHYALEPDYNISVFQCLLNFGADLKIKNNEGFTPLEVALKISEFYSGTSLRFLKIICMKIQ